MEKLLCLSTNKSCGLFPNNVFWGLFVFSFFFFLFQEEAEVKSDGTHTTLKPSQYSVARITVIRG